MTTVQKFFEELYGRAFQGFGLDYMFCAEQAIM
jgi:hypothetical protein